MKRPRQTWTERYGYPLWYVWGLFAIIMSIPGGILMAFKTGSWEWLTLPLAAGAILWVSSRA